MLNIITHGGETCQFLTGIFMLVISIRRFRTPVSECIMHPQP